jgi:hypothetical protein
MFIGGYRGRSLCAGGSNTRSHGFLFDGDDRVSMLHRARKYYFLNRVVNYWNKLPSEVLGVTSVDDFKKKLESIVAVSVWMF